MTRIAWNAACTKGEQAAFDYFKEPLTIKSGEKVVELSGVLDTSQNRNDRVKSPDGTFPVLASLSCWRAELGWLPSVGEAMRIAQTAIPEEEQMYQVVSVDTVGDMMTVELQANTSNASPFFK